MREGPAAAADLREVALDAGADDGDRPCPCVERALMYRAIDALGEPRNDDDPGAAAGLGELAGDACAVRRHAARSDDAHRASGEGLEIAIDPERLGRVA